MTAAVILIAAGAGIIFLAAWVVIAERLDGPGTPARQAPEETPGALARGTSPFPMLPPDPEPDPTRMQPHDVMYLGMTSGEYVDELFAKHAEAQQ
jgi:hypothetical protein